MSSLEKMIIQGIRSFGPDEKDRQIICFFSPLTLILGPNGTGKTTVIECLKYMTTGVMPPGSKGGAFIHDPKVAHEREVKGQVRLRIRDVTNQQMTIMRSIVATQKQKKIETRTIDGVISRISPTGEKKSITSRCAEIDREMITALGVSRPVLEHVIFCHQEESNWPLSEGKALKEKFDAIFASTRYVKALENIRKLKQSQEGEIKLLRQEILFLKQHKEKALALEGDLHATEIKLESSKESMEKIASKLDPIEKQLKDISVRANEIFQIQNRKTKYESDRDALFKTVKELKSNIKNEFSGSMEELQQSCDDFKIRVDEKRFKLQKCIKEQEEIGREIEGLNRKKNVLLVEVGKLQQEAQTNEENENKRDGQLRQIAQKYGFVGFDGEITQEVYRHFAESVKTKVEALMDEREKTKTEFEKKERDAQIELEKLREKKTSYEQNEKIKRDIMLDNMRKIEQIENKLSEVKVSAGRLEHLNRELRRAEHDLQTTDRSLDINVLKKEIQELSIEKASLDQSVNDLGAEMKRLHLQSAAQAQLDILRKDKATKEESIKRLKAKQEDSLNHLLGNVPARNLRGQLEEYISKQGPLVKKVTENLNTQKSRVSSLEARKMMLMEDLKKKEANLKDFEERIFTVCERSGFEDGLKSLQVKKTDVQNKKGSLLGAEHFFNKYIEDLGKKDPCCPLCHREFDTDQEVKELVLELKNKLRMVPSKLEKAELELKEFEKKYDRMMQLKPIKENIVTLEENDIPETKRKLSSVINEIQETHKKIQELDDEKAIQEQDEDIAKQLHPDVIQIDRYQGEITELDRKIAVQAALLPGGDTGRNLQDVSNEEDEKQMILDDVTRKLEQKKEQINSHNEELQMLHKKVNDLRSHILTIDSDVQQQQKMQEDKNNLETDNHSYELEIKDCQEQIIPIKAQIEKYSREKDKVTEMKEEKLEDIKEETEAIKLEASKVRTINQSIKQYTQSGKASELANRQDELETIKMDAASKEREQDSLNTALERLRNDIATQQTRERELLDNLSLRKKQNEIQEIEALVEAEERKLGGIDANDLDRKRRRLMTEQDSLVKERHMAVGRQSGFEDTIRTLQKELQSEMYRDAAEKYRDKIIMLKTTEMANGDLEKYYKALDKAIMNYHNVKMEEINKIIREIWRNTYRGNDIETIEIRSDEDDSAATMKTRKTYNYRVVMVKGDTALDMRGRCSAGQKVLASLIIRMALAETFCLNCGVLALDEPTTNLDRENIESLAYALVEIIKSRSHQKNFQLVVITHDEDFVELLGRSDYVEKFYKVRKNSEGLSQLVEARVQELHTR